MRPLHRHRLPAAIAAAGALALVLLTAACRPAHAGSAAIVGSDSIGVGTVQREVTDVLKAADQQTASTLAGHEADLQRQVLTRLIDGLILEAAAQTRHVTLTEGEVDSAQANLLRQAGGEDQLRQQAIQSGIAPDALRSVVRQIALNSKLAQAVVADVTVTPDQLAAAYQQNIAQYDQVHAAHILVRDQATAERLLAQVKADPSSFAKLAAANSIDTQSKDNGGDLGTNGQSAFDPSFGKPVFAAKPGSYLVVHTQFGWHVVHVITHQRTSLAEATPELRTSILKSESDKRLGELLTTVMKRLHIDVNPRYGYWDPAQRAVAAPRDDLSRPVPTPTPSPSNGLVPQAPSGG